MWSSWKNIADTLERRLKKNNASGKKQLHSKKLTQRFHAANT
jgi:hypothetical protein